MEKLLIITEKPSAGRNFTAALGGSMGTFDGDPYVIVHLRGHILAHEAPEKVAYPNYAETVGGFGHVENLPWSHTYFDFKKKAIPKGIHDFAAGVIADIKQYIKEGYIPVIASDVDAMGEGDLLVQEVLDYIHYNGKVYREYHEDETPKCIQKAIRDKKDVTQRNEGLLAGETRMTLDFLTQQIVRLATVSVQEQGYRIPRPVPVGRLQSTIMNFVGTQLEEIKNYKPTSYFESRYNLDDILVLSNKDMKQYKSKEEWQADGLPMESMVKEVKQVPGKTIPPKALTLTGLGALLSGKGLRAKQTQDLAQKMYDAGVLSYPRTEDNFITPEQFEEMLPMVDSILGLLSLSPSIFTHRTPRSTHVKVGGSHGALRPGRNMPNSLDGLDAQFGRGAASVYRAVAERFVMMFLEDTEWVRHEYETVDTPVPFTGSVRVITRAGVSDPDADDKDVVTALPNLSHKAKLYPHEVKSTKPKTPNEAWLLNKLKKENVGTASTQLSTVARLVGTDNNAPLIAGKKTSEALTLSPIGVVGYQVASKISLGSAECTRDYEAKIKQVIENKCTQEQIYKEFTDVITKDIGIIRGMTFDLSGLGFSTCGKKIDGIWNGQPVRVSNTVSGYTMSDEEMAQLFAGQKVPITGKDFNGNPLHTSVYLAQMMYNGKPCVGYRDTNYCYGTWQGEEVRFKRSYMSYTFSDAECDTLLAGGDISFSATDKQGNVTTIHGKLEKQKAPNGSEFVGFKGVFPLREGYVEGVFNGQPVRFKGSFSDHVFTKEEIDRLLAGQSIVISYTNKSGQKSQADGKLEWQMYQGKRFLGFKANFGKSRGK